MKHPFSRRLAPYLPLLLVTIVAAAFRVPLLDSLPPGLNFDEGGEGIAALDVTRGMLRLWWPIGGGKEPLMAYMVQPLFALFGPTRLALRLYAALWGVAAVAAAYFLAAQLFPSRRKDDPLASLLPAAAALGLATAFWHVAYSRIAFRAISNPAVEALALGFLWRGLRTGRRRDFVLAGICTGGLIYTYQAGRFVPLAVALFLAAEALLARRAGVRPLLAHRWRGLATMAGAAAIVFLPAALFFLQNPGVFVERGQAASIFNPAMNHGDLWGALVRATLTTLGTFLSLTGDPNSLGNIPGKPELGLLLAGLFLLGWVAGAKLETRNSEPATLFLWIWWPVMLLPAVLAPEGAPHHLRLIGAAPGTYIFVALGLAQISRWIAPRWGGGAGWLLLLAVFGLAAAQTYSDYFIRWANDVDHYMDFDVYAEELAAQMAADRDPAVAYAIPVDLRAAHEARHYSLDFLYRGETPFRYVVVNEATAAQSLAAAARGATTLKVVRWTQDKHREADARELVTFLLATAGAVQTAVEPHPVYAIETYRLPSPQTRFALPAIRSPVDVTLAERLQVRRAAVLPERTPAGDVAVAVTYAPVAPLDVDYKASLRLVGPDGAVVAQKDRALLHNWHQGASLWPREEVNEYYLLPLPPDAPPGEYTVQLVIYHPDTLAPLGEQLSIGNYQLSKHNP